MSWLLIKSAVLLLLRVYRYLKKRLNFEITKALVPIVMVSYIILTRSSSFMYWPREARKAFYP